MPPETISTLVPYAVNGLVTLGMAYGAVKAGMNGMEKRLTRVENKVDSVLDANTEQSVRIAVLEDRGERENE